MKGYRALCLLCLFLLLSSCEGFLTEEPRNIIAPSTFFKTETEAIAAVNGVYAQFYGLYRQEIDRYLIYGTDLVTPTRFAPDLVAHQYTMSPSNNGRIRGIWRNLYSIVVNANLVIARVEIADIDDGVKTRVLGEARFLRAMAYYHLTNMFGDVVFFTDELDVESVSVQGRSPRAEVEAQILQDLQDAETALPESYDGSDLGRASRWAAKTLLAKMYLAQENWSAARDKAVEIINNSPHRLLDSYADVFDQNNTYNDELIWVIDYVVSLRSTSRGSWFQPRAVDENFGTSIDPVTGLPHTHSGFGLAGPTLSFADTFDPDDLRYPIHVSREAAPGIPWNRGPYMPKFWEPHGLRNNSGQDFPVFRMADVYLMAAEAENEASGPGGALSWINTIRQRAGLPDLAGLGQGALRDAIRQERAWELAAEGHRRYDLTRWGILVETVRATDYGGNSDAAQNIQPHHIFFPLSSQELLLNPNLTQTPGY